MKSVSEWTSAPCHDGGESMGTRVTIRNHSPAGCDRLPYAPLSVPLTVMTLTSLNIGRSSGFPETKPCAAGTG